MSAAARRFFCRTKLILMPALLATLSAFSAKVARADEEPKSAWYYSERTDKMRGTNQREASLGSEERSLGPNKYGTQGNWPELDLTLRSAGKGAPEIIAEIPSGMLMCDAYQYPTVAVKFDNKPVARFPCSAASDNVFTAIFINDEARFLKQLRTAKTLIVEVNFYQRGPRQFTFHPAGLLWK